MMAEGQPTSNDAVRALCERFDYPAGIEALLGDLVEAVRAAHPTLRSLVLSGSAATGDLVHRERDGALHVLSDIDAMAFVAPGPSHPERLAEAKASLEEQQPSPLFQLDVSINPVSALARIAPSYQMAETRESGVVLYGEDVLDRFPEHFDPRSAREGLLANLWKPVVYWTPPGSGFDFEYVQVVARFCLDVSILATGERGLCWPGHRARTERLLAGEIDTPLIDDAMRGHLEWALEARRHPSDERDGLEAKVASVARHAIGALAGEGPVDLDDAVRLEAIFRAWLSPRDLRRLAGEAKGLASSRPWHFSDLRWLWMRKQSVGAAGLCGVIARLARGAKSEIADPARGALARYGRRSPDAARPFGVLQAKEWYWAGLRTLYPALSKKSAEYEPLLAIGD